jgi:heme-degrading monooxygenase HmoA
MFTRVWDYDVVPELRSRFEEVYGPQGEWAALFQQADGYGGTQLFIDALDPNHYLTVDRWTDRASWERFATDHEEAYRELGERHSALTVRNEGVLEG